MAAKPNKERYTSIIYNGFIVPAKISFDAKDTFSIGIIAVNTLSSTHGSVPITAINTMAIFNGAAML